MKLRFRDNAALLLIRHGADVNICDLLSCGLDNLSIASRRRTSDLARILIKAGHYLPPLEPGSVPKPDSTMHWLYCVCKEPLSLSDLCRIKIRYMCKCRILISYIWSLPLPKSLKKFLMMEDEGIFENK
jgi:hypothetical protein